MNSTRVSIPACVALIAFASCQSGSPATDVQLQANASVTVFPVLLGTSSSAETAMVVGIFLERAGMQSVEVADAAFAPAPDAGFAAAAAAFGAFVTQRGLNTDYALFAAVRGSPGVSIDSVSAALVDRQGKVVWSEQQQKGSPAFDAARPDEPMECVALLAQRLRGPLQLADPMRAGAPEGKLARRMREQPPMPPQAEFDAMARRLEQLRQAGKPSIRVYPSRVGSEWSADGAKALATAIEQSGLAKATAVTEPVRFTVQASMNEQLTLWSAARSIQQAVRAAPVQQDYLLFTDYLMTGRGTAGAVHTFLLAPGGEFVIVDHQNSHHDDFERLAPASTAACSQLAAVRLAACLRR